MEVMLHVVERFVAVPVGMAVGYIGWLFAVTVLTATVPVAHMVVAVGAMLASMTIASFALALRFAALDRRPAARAFWCAPALPVAASVYLLIVFLN